MSKTPIEAATKAIGTLTVTATDAQVARAVFESIDRDELARVLAHGLDGPSEYEDWSEDYRNEIDGCADAILAHLTGGES